MSYYLKDPQAAVDYSVDWSAGYLGARTVTASAWAVVPAEVGGIVVVAEMTAPARCAATLEGGVRGHVYRVTNHVTLSDGRSDERSLVMRVEDR